jgi:SAM-dependent MidA family methyltransferase
MFHRESSGWREVLVDGLDAGDDVQFRFVKSSGATSPMRILKLETRYEGVKVGDSIEIAPESLRIARHFANLISRSGGMFVTVDYGSFDNPGNTLRVICIQRNNIFE